MISTRILIAAIVSDSFSCLKNALLRRWARRRTAGLRLAATYIDAFESRELLAAMIHVPADYTSIQDAINAAGSGDTIQVAAGVYIETLSLNKSVNLRGAGRDSTMIMPSNSIFAPVITITGGSEALIEGFTLTGGKNGGVVIVDASPTLQDNAITLHRRETRGSAIDVSGLSSPAILGNIISGNEHYQGSGHSGGFGTIFDSSSGTSVYAWNEVTGNNAWLTGGSMYLMNSSPLIHNNRFENNSADVNGGIVSIGGSPVIENNLLLNNIWDAIPNTDGAINVASGSAIIRFNTIKGNRGSGISVGNGATAAITGNIVVQNVAAGISGENQSTIDLQFNNIWGNTPDYQGTTAGPGSVSVDPQLDADFLPHAIQVIDAGPPGILDLNATRSDMGRSGGLGNQTSNGYTIETVVAGQNIEHRLKRDDFHFQSLIKTDGTRSYHETFEEHGITKYAKHGLIVRPHPDQGQPDGWGSSDYINSFIVGGDAEAGTFTDLIATSAGIYIRAFGNIIKDALGGSFGIWETSRKVSYDAASHVISGIGTQKVNLDDVLQNVSGDLNVYRIATNRLVDVPLTNGGIGNTGDVHSVNYQFAVGANLPGGTWLPESNSHFPGEHSVSLAVDLIGMTNSVDTAAMNDEAIAVARKPGYSYQLTDRAGQTVISFGGFFDSSKAMDPYADNAAVIALVRPEWAGSTKDFVFEVNTRAIVPLTPLVENVVTPEDTLSQPIKVKLFGDNGTLAPYFRISGIIGGTLYKNINGTPIADGTYVSFAEATAGLRFQPDADSNLPGRFDIESSRDGITPAALSGKVTSVISITPVADTPQVASITTPVNTLSGAIVINRHPADGAEVTHIRITGITGGTLFRNNGTTQINNGDFITFAEGLVGVKFQPSLNSSVTGHFTVQASVSNTDTGLGGSTVTASITVRPSTPVVTSPALTNISQRPTVAWSAAAGAASYEVWINNLSTNTKPFHKGTSTSTSYVPTIDLGIGQFRVWVRSKTSDGTLSPWSAARDFQVTTPVSVNALNPLQTTFRPTITWAALPGANHYDVWISNLSTGTSQVVRNMDVAGTTFQVATNLSAGKFRTWVRGIAADDFAGAWSIGVDFTVISPAPTVTHGQNTAFNRTPVLKWDSLPGTNHYDIWINNLSNGAVQAVRDINLTSTTFTGPNNLPIGKYRAWIRGIGADNFATAWTAPVNFSINGAPLVTQGQNSTFDRTPTFAWNVLPGAAVYEVYLRNLNTGATTLYNRNVTATQFTPSALAEGTYRWWTMGVTAEGFRSLWTSPMDIFVGGRPSFLSPSGTITDTTPTFSWKRVDGAVRYDLWVNREGGAAQLIREQTLTSTSFTPTTALADGTYRAWVRAVSSTAEISVWSAQVVFTIAENSFHPLDENAMTPVLTSVIRRNNINGEFVLQPAVAVIASGHNHTSTQAPCLPLGSDDTKSETDAAVIDAAIMEWMLPSYSAV